MLAQQLKELEYHDIVHREVYAQIPPKVEYSITEYGQLMKPVLQTMSDWGPGMCKICRSCTAKKTKQRQNRPTFGKSIPCGKRFSIKRTPKARKDRGRFLLSIQIKRTLNPLPL